METSKLFLTDHFLFMVYSSSQMLFIISWTFLLIAYTVTIMENGEVFPRKCSLQFCVKANLFQFNTELISVFNTNLMKEVLEVVKSLRNETGFFNFQDTSSKGKKTPHFLRVRHEKKYLKYNNSFLR